MSRTACQQQQQHQQQRRRSNGVCAGAASRPHSGCGGMLLAPGVCCSTDLAALCRPRPAVCAGHRQVTLPARFLATTAHFIAVLTILFDAVRGRRHA
jgi:hypothetical protein